MFGAVSGSSTGYNLPTFGYKSAQNSNVFVINGKRLVGTKAANLAASTWSPTASRATFAVAAALAARLI